MDSVQPPSGFFLAFPLPLMNSWAKYPVEPAQVCSLWPSPAPLKSEGLSEGPGQPRRTLMSTRSTSGLGEDDSPWDWARQAGFQCDRRRHVPTSKSSCQAPSVPTPRSNSEETRFQLHSKALSQEFWNYRKYSEIWKHYFCPLCSLCGLNFQKD